MLQFDLQFYEELTVAWVRTVKFISGAFFLADRSACLGLFLDQVVMAFLSPDTMITLCTILFPYLTFPMQW